MQADIGSLLVTLDMLITPYEHALARAHDVLGMTANSIERRANSMVAGVVNSLAKIGEKAASIGAPMRAAGTELTLAGAAISGSLIAAAYEYSSSGDAIGKMAKRLGIGTEALTQMQYAADLSGASIGELENGFRFLQRSIGEASTGSKEANARFTQLGISLDAIRSLPVDKQFEMVADAISKIKDPAMRSQAAMDLFSRGGTMLLPLLNEGSSGIEKMRKEAEDLGYVLDEESIRAAEEFNDQLGRMKTGLERITFAIGAEVAPVIADYANWISHHVRLAKEWIEANGSIIRAITYIGGTMTILGTALFTIGTGFIWLNGVIQGVNAAIVAAPIVWRGLLAVLSPAGIAIGLVITALLLCAEAFGIVDVGLLKWINSIRIGGTQIGTYLKDAGLTVQEIWETVAYSIEYALLRVKGVAIDTLAIAAKAMQNLPGFKNTGHALALFAKDEQMKNASGLKWLDSEHDTRMQALNAARFKIYAADSAGKKSTAVEKAAGPLAAAVSTPGAGLVSSTNFQAISTGRMSLSGLAGTSTSAKTQDVHDKETGDSVDKAVKLLQKITEKSGILS